MTFIWKWGPHSGHFHMCFLSNCSTGPINPFLNRFSVSIKLNFSCTLFTFFVIRFEVPNNIINTNERHHDIIIILCWVEFKSPGSYNFPTNDFLLFYMSVKTSFTITCMSIYSLCCPVSLLLLILIKIIISHQMAFRHKNVFSYRLNKK